MIRRMKMLIPFLETILLKNEYEDKKNVDDNNITQRHKAKVMGGEITRKQQIRSELEELYNKYQTHVLLLSIHEDDYYKGEEDEQQTKNNPRDKTEILPSLIYYKVTNQLEDKVQQVLYQQKQQSFINDLVHVIFLCLCFPEIKDHLFL